MAEKEDLQTFLDAFSIVASSDDENEQAEEYGHIQESDEPFDELAEQLSQKIESTEVKGEALNDKDLLQEIDNVCKDDGSQAPQGEKKPEEAAELGEGEPADEEPFVTDPQQESAEEVKYDSIGEDGPAVDSGDDEESSEGTEDTESEDTEGTSEDDSESSPEGASEVEFQVDVGGNEPDDVKVVVRPSGEAVDISYDPEIRWKLKSPSRLWDSFYTEKNINLRKMLVKGPLDFDALSAELIEASVDLGPDVFDKDIVNEKMMRLQQHRERLKEISIRVNAQYFAFKRFYPLLEGMVAQVQYLKPQKKQDGLVCEHLGDVAAYLSRLEDLHEAVNSVEGTLKAAFDTLSRRVAIYMELKAREVYFSTPIYPQQISNITQPNVERPDVSAEEESTIKYDRIPVDAEVKKSPAYGVLDTWAV
jgi:hypothetical protein